ncbi:MAG: hypothetical protein ABGX20_21885 [Bacillus sp. (in: firmicutes)]
MNPYNYYGVPQQMPIEYHTYVPAEQMYPYVTHDQYDQYDPNRQPQQLERRVNQLERQNERQEREINQLQRDVNQLQRRLQRVNQRVRVLERRFNIPFTPFDGEF